MILFLESKDGPVFVIESALRLTSIVLLDGTTVLSEPFTEMDRFDLPNLNDAFTVDTS